MGVQHQATEGGPQVKGQCFVHHAEKDKLHIQLFGDLIDGKVLTVQTHAGEELQLVPEKIHAGFMLTVLSNVGRDFFFNSSEPGLYL